MIPAVTQTTQPLRLHIGGTEPRAGWRIFNIEPGPHVDYVGDCLDLSRFADNSVAEVYASHVYEHLPLNGQLEYALHEVQRKLVPGGAFRVSVPNMDILCFLFMSPERTLMDRTRIMRVMFGGHITERDAHHVGLNEVLLRSLLHDAGFGSVERVINHGLFTDSSERVLCGLPISLNMVATK